MKNLSIYPMAMLFTVCQLNATPISDELLLLHNVTTAEMNAIASPAKGSLIFNTDDKEIYERNATAWSRISSDGSETKIIAGSDIDVTGTGSNADPYVISVQVFASCSDVTFNTDGEYLIDSDGAGGDSPYIVYCDMTTDGGGWARLVRTTGNDHQFGQRDDAINYASASDPIGIYETYRKIKNFSKVMIKKVGTADFASYDLVSAVAGDSIYDIMTYVKGLPVKQQDDTAYDGTRVKGLTSEYSGTKVAGTLPFNYFFMAGINESYDNDQSYITFADSTGSSNSWGDSWRRTGQVGTLWSLLNGDYYVASNYHIGNGYSQAGAGYKGANSGTYEIYIK